MKLNESSLHAGDLRNLVNHIFEIDSYQSKMGDDKDVVVLSFTVDGRDPANDLVNFVEKGYQFVLDADMTPGELSNGRYKVFVELQRTPHVIDHISSLLYGIGKLTDIEQFKFRYYKSFDSKVASAEELQTAIPTSPSDYINNIEQIRLESFQGFFNKSMVESINTFGDFVEFKKIWAEPIRFRYVTSGNVQQVLESIDGRISVSMNDMADVMFLTKYLGNYNITKLDNKFMFESNGHAVVLERLK